MAPRPSPQTERVVNLFEQLAGDGEPGNDFGRGITALERPQGQLPLDAVRTPAGRLAAARPGSQDLPPRSRSGPTRPRGGGPLPGPGVGPLRDGRAVGRDRRALRCLLGQRGLLHRRRSGPKPSRRRSPDAHRHPVPPPPAVWSFDRRLGRARGSRALAGRPARGRARSLPPSHHRCEKTWLRGRSAHPARSAPAGTGADRAQRRGSFHPAEPARAGVDR